VVGIDYTEPAAHLVALSASARNRQGSMTVRRLVAVLATAVVAAVCSPAAGDQSWEK